MGSYCISLLLEGDSKREASRLTSKSIHEGDFKGPFQDFTAYSCGIGDNNYTILFLKWF